MYRCRARVYGVQHRFFFSFFAARFSYLFYYYYYFTILFHVSATAAIVSFSKRLLRLLSSSSCNGWAPRNIRRVHNNIVRLYYHTYVSRDRPITWWPMHSQPPNRASLGTFCLFTRDRERVFGPRKYTCTSPSAKLHSGEQYVEYLRHFILLPRISNSNIRNSFRSFTTIRNKKTDNGYNRIDIKLKIRCNKNTKLVLG